MRNCFGGATRISLAAAGVAIFSTGSACSSHSQGSQLPTGAAGSSANFDAAVEQVSAPPSVIVDGGSVLLPPSGVDDLPVAFSVGGIDFFDPFHSLPSAPSVQVSATIAGVIGTWDIEPSGPLTAPVYLRAQLTAPLSPGQVLFVWRQESGVWSIESEAVVGSDGQHLLFSLDHFSLHAIYGPEPPNMCPFGVGALPAGGCATEFDNCVGSALDTFLNTDCANEPKAGDIAVCQINAWLLLYHLCHSSCPRLSLCSANLVCTASGCACPAGITCSSGQVVDPNACMCECPTNVTCPAGQVLDPTTCICECPSGTIACGESCATSCNSAPDAGASCDPPCPGVVNGPWSDCRWSLGCGGPYQTRSVQTSTCVNGTCQLEAQPNETQSCDTPVDTNPGVLHRVDAASGTCDREYYWCELNPPAPTGSDCSYVGCNGHLCQQNSCAPCPGGDCSQCLVCSSSIGTTAECP